MANIQDFRFGVDEDEKTLDQCRVFEPMTLPFQLKRKHRLIWEGGMTRIAGKEDDAGDGDEEAGDGDSDSDDSDVTVRRRRRKDNVRVRELHSGRNSPSEGDERP